MVKTKGELTLKDCKNWKKNKNINPQTNRALNVEKNTYKKIKTTCEGTTASR